MRTIPNKRLTTNYTLWEMIEGQLPENGKRMNWSNIDQMDLLKIQEAAEHAQVIRDLINKEFKSDISTKEIKLRINSGWRCRDWELNQKRSGKSQHTIAAYDAVPINCSPELAARIIAWLYGRFSRSYMGGLAIKDPTIQNGIIVSAGFIHFDFRGHVARWKY